MTTKQRHTIYRQTLLTGQTVGECSNCGMVCVHWDSEDLDEDGNIYCNCQDLDRD